MLWLECNQFKCLLWEDVFVFRWKGFAFNGTVLSYRRSSNFIFSFKSFSEDFGTMLWTINRRRDFLGFVFEYQYHPLSLLLKTKHFCPAVNSFKSLPLFCNITLDFFHKTFGNIFPMRHTSQKSCRWTFCSSVYICHTECLLLSATHITRHSILHFFFC